MSHYTSTVPELTDDAIESIAEILVGALCAGELDQLLNDADQSTDS